MTETVAAHQLRSFVERIERLDEEIKSINDDKKEVFAEAKGNGFDTKAIKRVIQIRRQDRSERLEFEAIVDLYLDALGMAPNEHEVEASRVHAHEEADPETGELPPSETADQSGGNASRSDAHLADESASKVSEVPSTVAHGVEEGQKPSAAVAENAPTEISDEMAPDMDDTDGSANTGGDHVTGHDDSNDEKHRPGPADGRTGDGSEASIGAVESGAPVLYAPPGEVVMERCPPEGVKWHRYAVCFPTVSGLLLDGLRDDIQKSFEGVKQPIVKIGRDILDGRARYTIARELQLDYPVVQYAGNDPLRDVIAWNLASRDLTEKERDRVARSLCACEPERADEIRDWLGVSEEMGAA